MEEGGEIRPYYNACNKDHLATVKETLEAREEKSNKQWLVCGFNGFGQLKFENKRKLLQFEDIEMPLSNKNSHNVLVACSWNCLAIANENSLYLQGFISNSPKAVKHIKTEVPIISIDICDKFCLILLKNGKVYKLLLKCEDELQEITFQTSLIPILPQKRNIFGEIKKATETCIEIAHIACGNNITIAVSTTNVVFSGTTQIFQFPKHYRIKQLKCGFEHALLLNTNGDIYAWGNGLRGQLGLEVLRVEETPTLIEALAGIKITYISCGGWHSAAISAFGDLYTWGFNSNGQLGLRLYKTSVNMTKEPKVYPLPQLIDLATCECDESKKENTIDLCCYPIKVAAGGRHTIVQMNCGLVYASGWNAYCQLGLAKAQEYNDNFDFVIKVKNDKQIICGNWCTIIEK